ncbi:uncharacterized protein J7T54_000035 [Emericellopsis cladophorae]|uniref:Patatin-like phospholipase domain-containing protein n=1 Tax=Emericellopsis cladophorae TaxID=2686198 RepID=A0A9P9XYB8_9HYPO|nr:uncharacterized protein J7T54_000035 [Emericellopsis cladophorae]KAI6780129.1 hypothetical protein J7T54_000035 [Emericellopsis cladophorae]
MSFPQEPFRLFDTPNYGFPPEAFDTSLLPDVNVKFLDQEDIRAFERALQAPDPLQSPVDETASLRSSLRSPSPAITKRNSQVGSGLEEDVGAVASDGFGQDGAQTPTAPTFITAQNDWAPVNSKIYKNKRGSKRRRNGAAKGAVEGLLGTRTKDETREGYFYQLLKWPLLLFVVAWLAGLGLAYLSTRLYIWVYEQFFTWRGKRQQLRSNMRRTANYKDWVAAAKELDGYLGRQAWKEENSYAYYDHKSVRKVWEQMRKMRAKAEGLEKGKGDGGKTVDELRALIEACVKNNFVGVENARLYSQTYYGTKNLVQNFVDETEKSLKFMLKTKQLTQDEKRDLFKHVNANFGRTALCLSGGAAFAYYHIGVARALLDADLLPDIITGTSGGALVSALIATRTNEELDKLLVPALAFKINACGEDCVIWSAVLASAAVPGILNPVVLMMKTRDGTLVPYSFGHKWKDGSLRTDIPIKALNTHFNVNFTIVSQVNPHINLFFFSSRGSVGHPVTHRKGRGWRGGYLMSAFEHYLKLDMNKWLKFIRHAELLPRPLGQDWSQLWLQQFSGTITIWPKSIPSDFIHLLTDPDPPRLARMIHEGKQSAFPKLKFIANRLKQERLVEQGRRETRPWIRDRTLHNIMSEEDLRSLLVDDNGTGMTTEEDTDVEDTGLIKENAKGLEMTVLEDNDSDEDAEESQGVE